MANNDLKMGQNDDLSLRQNQSTGSGQNHNLVAAPGENFSYLEMCDAKLDMSLDKLDNDLGLEDTKSRREAFSEAQEHDLALEDNNLLNFAENKLCMDGNNNLSVDQDNAGIGFRGDELVVTFQNHGFGTSESRELAIMGTQDFDDELDWVPAENQDMQIVPVSNMSVGQPQPAVSPPVSQSMALVTVPDHELKVGQEFPDARSCRRALRAAAIALRFEMQTVKSDKTRFTAKCASEGCPWRIHAAKLSNSPTFTIRTIHDAHTCDGINHLGHQQASVQWVSDTMGQHLKENPFCKPKEILEEIHRIHGITLTYKQAWRGRERYVASIRGSFEEEYRLLPLYCDQIRSTNPGSIAVVYGNPIDNSFERLFIAFQASIYGFLNACPPLIGLDRYSLKSKYLGTLLLAGAFDGDGDLFPLAFGVVNEENDDNWMWFLSELRNLLESNTGNMPKLTIISSRQKGILDAVEANFPTAFHGYCMLHLIECFRKDFNSSMLVNMFWEAAYALTANEFEQKMSLIQDMSSEAASWIRKFPQEQWATAHFEGRRFGHLTTNVVESLSTWLQEASGLPIVQMIESMRRQLMICFNERREKSVEWESVLVPYAEKQVCDAIEKAPTCQVIRATNSEFEVLSSEGSFIVDVHARRCTCFGWQLNGLPCSHAVAALLCCRQNVVRFAESFFTVGTYRKAYSQTIHPVPDRSLWQGMLEGFQNNKEQGGLIINPPKGLRPPGQPKKRRVRKEDSSNPKRIVHCSRCNQTGHFRTTCSAPM
ncbi:uncharacterized protein LOC120010664 [Tripterygium wilfordii]|uniref:uncharacterized protein LOC120010664 n=1 Tax=Tripterygium wilfordii TaxID=458696 RepID=UPI0018F7EB60|nr:uncharacterized protein LOC120010664 [Tripterygium wilfordii]XP_038717386.1 uncharacterized protein LOC120010664 [Tripterygium wilfordii]